MSSRARFQGGDLVRRAIGFLLGPICAALLVSLLVTPQPRPHHEDSSAFQTALQQAVDRLESGGRLLLAGTATPVLAGVQQPTYDGRYTCDTYEVTMLTCDPAGGLCPAHTSDPQGHTCVAGEYTCDLPTCDTYDPQQLTCDTNDPACGGPALHTFEPPPYNHTCDSYTCDGHFTCDFTVDPRAETCDAADPMCMRTTFDAFIVTCNVMLPECRQNNPDACTALNYPTCTPGVPTCDPIDPACATVDPSDPACWTPTETTTWGQVKAKYQQE